MRIKHLTPALLITTYSAGIFPMADSHQEFIYWNDPDPRSIIPLDGIHIPRSLKRRIRQQPYEIRVDTAFEAVMRACAAPAKGRNTTWINDEFIRAYTQLFGLGYAHSVEAYLNGRLVGGLYGVSLGGLFAGESMFSLANDASKIAFIHLVARLRLGGYTLLDSQMRTDHMARFGLIDISRAEYHALLAAALPQPATFYPTAFPADQILDIVER